MEDSEHETDEASSSEGSMSQADALTLSESRHSDTDKSINNPKPTAMQRYRVCPLCHLEFASIESLCDHIGETHNDALTDAGPSGFVCPLCDLEFATQDFLDDHTRSHEEEHCIHCALSFNSRVDRDIHMSFEHPKCMVCDITFFNIDDYNRHRLRQHPENRSYEGELPSESEDENDAGSDVYMADIEDRQFKKHIDCVTIDRFMEIHNLIERNQFETLANDDLLLDALQIIFKGVIKGYIPICSLQRQTLDRPMKKLLFNFGKSASTTLLLRNKTTLKRLFKILWSSVEHVVTDYSKYGE